MQKIKKYRVVYGVDELKLEDDVNDLLSLGWVPIGGFSVEITLSGSSLYYQAMGQLEEEE